MLRLALCLLLVPGIAGACRAATRVFVVHGYGSSPLVMLPLANHLRDAGFDVCNWGYRSLTRPVPQVAADLLAEVRADSLLDTVHFVTHSMGGLVVRSLLGLARAEPGRPVIHRIVMIAPPNRGAQLADGFSGTPLSSGFMGPNVGLMRTDSAGPAESLPLPDREEYGVITGLRMDGRGYNPLIEGDNDGFMTADRTRLGVEDDTLSVRQGHLLITGAEVVHNQVLHFLQHGRFRR